MVSQRIEIEIKEKPNLLDLQKIMEDTLEGLSSVGWAFLVGPQTAQIQLKFSRMLCPPVI